MMAEDETLLSYFKLTGFAIGSSLPLARLLTAFEAALVVELEEILQMCKCATRLAYDFCW